MNATRVARVFYGGCIAVALAGPVVAYVRPPDVPASVGVAYVVQRWDQPSNVQRPTRLDISYQGWPGTVASALEDCWQSGGEPIGYSATVTTDTLVCEGVDY